MGVSCSLQNRLQILQNKALRAVYNMKNTDSVREIMKEEKLLNLTQTATLSTMLLVKSITDNPSLKHLIPGKGEGRSRASTNKEVKNPFYKTALLQQQCSYLCPRIWNIFPLEIRQLKLLAFKQNIKQILLQDPEFEFQP
jgi:hypothetical protein